MGLLRSSENGEVELGLDGGHGFKAIILSKSSLIL